MCMTQCVILMKLGMRLSRKIISPWGSTVQAFFQCLNVASA